MAAPTLQAQGATVANTTGSLTVTLPAHQADDILILGAIFWGPNSGAMNNIPTPSGWTQIDFQLQDANDFGRLAWFWKRAASSSESNPVISRGGSWDTGADTCFGGRAYVIRGCITTGDPWDAVATAGPYTTANQAFPAVTVSGSERMVVIFGNSQDNLPFAMTSSGWTTGTEDNDPTGTDCAFQTARKDNVSSSTAADAATVSAPAQGIYGFLGISFKPPASAQTISGAGGIGSGEAFGTAKINMEVRPSAIGSGEGFGTSRLNLQVRPTGIPSEEVFGFASISGGAVSDLPPSQPVRIAINRGATGISIRGG